MNPGYGTVQWLDSVFKTRARSEELLRPELENGVISQHDYELATQFLPGYHRYYPYIDGGVATSLTTAYGTFYRKPRWPQPRLVLFGSIAYVVGAFAGQLRRASAHLNFVKTLDDRAAFFHALQNVHRRLGGESTLDWLSVPARDGGGGAPGPGPMARAPLPRADVHGDVPQPVEGDAPWTAAEPFPRAGGASAAEAAPPDTPGAQGAQVAAHAKSRWNEIRTANARGAQASSWDALRQQHERRRNVDDVQQQQPPAGLPGMSDLEAERAQEQARFDAMLEAERKIAGG
ncbi:hypothetical protein PsYK624_037110 [Phanerochaete sordida]|uniref:Uncharacterized protein n=1 Tax=Phanerochaete sordida TaxID=48140 RepID=A0A9P3LB49_9APHY|nr:hypothetical protein PsYK624_037110 [Phanerochaete sordida]